MNAPARSYDFIGDLCIALAHRWEPERFFMILTGYFDESGTHASAQQSLMAGFIGDARQWRKFEKRTTKLFKRYRVDIYHSIDLKRTDKDFRGWAVDRKIEFIDEFNHIVNETLERGFVSILKNEDWNYYKSLDWPRKARRDSRYTLMFRASMASVIHAVLATPAWRSREEPRLNIVLEAGHPNAPDAVRVYNFFRSKFPDGSKALAGLTFETKENSLPLAAADMLAYTAHLVERGGKWLGTPKGPMKSDVSYRRNIHRKIINRQTLAALHEQALATARSAV